MTIEEYNQSTIDEWDDYAANSAECYISPFYCFMEAKGGTYSGKTYVSVTCNKETDEGNDTIEYKYENGEFKIYINNELYVEEESDT
jgi:predicted metal-dependent phosphoesterase TrpH